MDTLVAFNSFRRIGFVSVDGAVERYPDFRTIIPEPGPGEPADAAIPQRQQGWQWGPLLPDRSGIIVSSFEETAIEKVVIGDLRTRVWLFDFETATLRPILEGERPSIYTTFGGFLPDGSGVIAASIIDGEQRLFLAEGDPASPVLRYRPLTGPGEGFHYGIDVAPDGSALVCHVTGGKPTKTPSGYSGPPYPSYSIHHITLPAAKRTVLYGDRDHLYFAPTYSPEGDRLVFLDCMYHDDPAHFWADLCVVPSSPDEHTGNGGTFSKAPTLTSGQSHWFGTSYGPADHRGGGSNMSVWTNDRKRVTYTRKLPDSHPDCFYDATRPDHQENVFRPENARGGTQICTIDPSSGEVTEITSPEDGRWDFRTAIEPDSGRIAFARYRIGGPAELFRCDADGSEQTRLTAGYEGHGADHPRWVPEALLSAIDRALESHGGTR